MVETAAVTVAYRIVLSNPATIIDFTSNKGKGLPQRDNETDDIYAGLSSYSTLGQARYTARRFTHLGASIASVNVTGFRVEQTFRPGHYTI